MLFIDLLQCAIYTLNFHSQLHSLQSAQLPCSALPSRLVWHLPTLYFQFCNWIGYPEKSSIELCIAHVYPLSSLWYFISSAPCICLAVCLIGFITLIKLEAGLQASLCTAQSSTGFPSLSLCLSMVTVHLPSFLLPARSMPKKRRSCVATEAAASSRK